jgi:hypothetical protein
MVHSYLRRAAAAGLICTASILISIPFPLTATTYIGMYADEPHSECSSYPVPYQLVSFWVWVLPGEDGMLCVDYGITVPSNIIQAATIINPEAGNQIGDALVRPGVTVCFPACRTGWVWTHQLQCLVTDAAPSMITLDPHGDYGILRSTTCVEPGYPVEEMRKVNDLFLNQECCLATRESSWGAIKSLMR